MNKQALKTFLILTGAMVARRISDANQASKFADHFACACVRKFPVLTEQDELDISDAVWTYSTGATSVTILWAFL